MTKQNKSLEARLQREARKVANSFETFDSFFSRLEAQRESRAIYEYEAELVIFFEERLAELISHTIAETLKAAVSAIEGGELSKVVAKGLLQFSIAEHPEHKKEIATRLVKDIKHLAITAVEGVGKNE